MGVPFYRITKRNGFKNKNTISHYSIRLCFEKLNSALLNNEIKRAMFWTSELLCSGYIEKLWEFIFDFYAMYIHIHYPNMIQDIYQKYMDYIEIKRTTRAIEIRNNIKIRDYLYRIIYIYSTINKRFIIDLFNHHELFKSFRVIHVHHKHLDPTDDVLMKLSEHDAKEIIAFVNDQSKDQIDNAIEQIRLLFAEFIKFYDDTNDKTKYLIYNWLSFLLEKGTERFDLYKTDEYVHLKHCRNENKYSYFIWIIWNILLEKSSKLPLKNEIRILYRIYEGYKDNQSTHAYYLIIASFLLTLEKIQEKKIFIDGDKYNKSKLYFYKCFGFIEEGLLNNEDRRDKLL